MFNGLRHVSTQTVELGVAHLVNFFHDFFVGEGIKADNVGDVLHELVDCDAARFVRVRNAELRVERVNGTFSKFFDSWIYNFQVFSHFYRFNKV